MGSPEFTDLYHYVDYLPEENPHFSRQPIAFDERKSEIGTELEPMPGDIFKYWYNYEDVEIDIELSPEEETVCLALIMIRKTCNRGKGYGSRCLSEICTWADSYGFPLELIPVPIRSEMTLDQLKSWYSSFGFLTKGKFDDTLRREPTIPLAGMYL